MRILSVFFLSVLVLSPFLAGCGEEEPMTGPLLLSGNFTGFVTLIDSNGSRLKDLSGVKVSIDGTSFSAMTDSLGKWNINEISTGIYTINYSKPSYGIYKAMNQGFVGGGTLFLNPVTLAQPPVFTVTIDSEKTLTDSNSIYIAGNATGVQGMGFSRVLIAIGASPDVSANDASKYLYATSTIVWSNSLMIGTHINKNDLDFAGLTSGTIMYAVLYPLSNGSSHAYTSYLDQNNGRLVYTSLGPPSAVVPVTIP
jgi:hypothetical protein